MGPLDSPGLRLDSRTLTNPRKRNPSHPSNPRSHSEKKKRRYSPTPHAPKLFTLLLSQRQEEEANNWLCGRSARQLQSGIVAMVCIRQATVTWSSCLCVFGWQASGIAFLFFVCLFVYSSSFGANAGSEGEEEEEEEEEEESHKLCCFWVSGWWFASHAELQPHVSSWELSDEGK